MHRKILIWGLLFSLLSIVFGAFGAHALKAVLHPEHLATFETGVRYQWMHGMALIVLSIYGSQNQIIKGAQKGLGWASNFFIAGIFCFSGSLYLLALASIFSNSWTAFLGPITPIGGLFFILGWSSWIWVVFLHKVDK